MSCSGIGHNNLSLRGALIIPISGGRQEFLPVTVCKLTSSPGQKVGTNVAFGSRLLQPNGRKTLLRGDGRRGDEKTRQRRDAEKCGVTLTLTYTKSGRGERGGAPPQGQRQLIQTR